MTKRKPPTQSPQCINDAATVLAVHVTAEAFYDRANNVVRIETLLPDDPFEATLGIGCTAESAWADAARNVTRLPLPELPATGSATWSLASDEVFWKNKPWPDHRVALR